VLKLKLKGQLLLPVLGIVVLGIVSLQIFTDYESSNILKTDVVEAISRDRDAAVRAVDEWFTTTSKQVQNWSKEPRVLAALQGDDEARESVERFAAEAVKDFTAFQDVELAGPTGIVIAGTSLDGKTMDVAERDYFQKGMQGKAFISQPWLSKITNSPVVVLSSPVRDEGGQVRGVLFVVVAFSSLYEEVLAPIKIGKTGYAFAIDNAGLIVGHPEQGLVMKKNIGDTPHGQAMLSQEIGFYEYYRPETSEQKLMAYGLAKAPGWRIAVSSTLNEALAPIKALRNMGIAGAVLTMVAVALVIFLVVRNITAGLRVAVDNAAEIAGGNVDIHMPEKLLAKGDELGDLARAIQQMAANLSEQFEEVKAQSALAENKATEAMEATKKAEEAQKKAESAKREGMLQAAEQLEQIVVQVASASDELNAQIQESRNGANVQRERTAESATAMEQMTATVLEVAGNASSAAENASNAQQEAEGGREVVNRVTASMTELSREAKHLHGEMTELGSQAEAIGRIMTVISDIADQTNLLALNAAIEAARAGDAGRGFAVVADEVRKLAEKTMTATQEVGDAIGAIQGSAGKSIKSMEETARMVAASTELTGEAQEALGRILENIGQTADQVRAIAAASEEQSAASEQINRGTEEINTVAGETLEAMEQSAIAVAELADLSDKLRTIIKEMQAS